jgi:hypothetical protein
MTIDDVMGLADKYADAYLVSVLDDDGPSDSNKERHDLGAALLALLDAEAEACHAIVSEEDLRWDAMDRIRARIAARKGGANG